MIERDGDRGSDCSCNADENGNWCIDRRTFIRSAGAAAAGVSLGSGAIAGPFYLQDTIDHFIPVDKKLRPEWIRMLFNRGSRSWFEGGELETIGMPVGGICAGQVYLTGDGRLTYWDIFNQNNNTGIGRVNYQVGRKPTVIAGRSSLVEAPAVDHGFSLQIKTGEKTITRTLDRSGFEGVRFCGEYPIGYVEFIDGCLPVDIKLEAFSPFIPLNAPDSALPAAIMNYTLQNGSADKVEVTIAGWLQNVVSRHSEGMFADRLLRRNSIEKSDGVTSLLCSADLSGRREDILPPVVFADFEGGNYGEWKVEGEAFGDGPAPGTLPGQQVVSGFRGRGLVNTFIDGDRPHGRLVSPIFTIERRYISFLIGGGSHEGETCINLLVDDETVRTATGRDNEYLQAHNWDVGEFSGRQGRIEIVDSASGGWGHVNIDQIEFRDELMAGDGGELETQSDYGTMALSVLSTENVLFSSSLPGGRPGSIFEAGAGSTGSDPAVSRAFDEKLLGMVGRKVILEAGEEKTVTFVTSWCMPNMRRGNNLVGNYYANRFKSATDVARYITGGFDRLSSETRLWHDTYYDSTLPWWLLDRLHSTVANLASATCQWWRNGRFWGWEGCGCCRGTCGHVWNYEHAMARLFPELERSVREMQDFKAGVGFHAEDGSIGFRGENYSRWAGDAQGGYLLKAYREHQLCIDDDFLIRNWDNIRKAMQFLVDQDGNADGILEGQQHQTYDEDYYGANTMVGSFYLGALRAAEEMAREVGDEDFAEECRAVFESGGKISVERLFNGEYFIQDVDLQEHPRWQYGDGCLADQMIGQGWAHQVGLGYLYPQDMVRSALKAIWDYCWAPDVGPHNEAHAPYRWYAYPGEAGLFTCTWPRSRHPGEQSTRYRNEIWTGIEYQVAGHMAWEGMLTEALAICRGIHERYHPSKHNPWNEIECGDHYARAMAGWGVLTGICGFEYHGPTGRLSFAPRLNPDNFKCVFTAAEGWGSLVQIQDDNRQINRIDIKWGSLCLNTLTIPAGWITERSGIAVRVDGREQECSVEIRNDRVVLQFDRLTLTEGQELEVINSRRYP